MSTLSASSLFKIVKSQRDYYFSDHLRENLVQKINDLSTTIEKLKQEITNYDSSYKDEFPYWDKDQETLQRIFQRLVKQRDDGIDETQKPKFDDWINRLDAIIWDAKELFLTQEIGLSEWNNNKKYLEEVLVSLETLGNQILSSDDVISYLKLISLNTHTSELGHFKEFARGLNDEGKSFTSIFYFLKDDEVSCFHKLHQTMKPERSPEETWIWLAGEPVSLYTKDSNLTEKVINEDNKDTTVPPNTWFAAKLSNGNHNTTEACNEQFSLVICHCSPSFLVSCYHDLTEKHKMDWDSLISIYQHSTEDRKKTIVFTHGRKGKIRSSCSGAEFFESRITSYIEPICLFFNNMVACFFPLNISFPY
ncbi:hypothetical protein TNIN_413291 [Trichonephila inaurata madagascariensis]|uniref:DUF985 domain-containing protein n=1 Tax=Trichonephila inaurata madagascariensis TaxID=2747483 RepID=A0A8X6XI74_9ARAC|nr:hypothetical protein TNIN_413291 [Trichonephila inaurata madagascariensis]